MGLIWTALVVIAVPVLSLLVLAVRDHGRHVEPQQQHTEADESALWDWLWGMSADAASWPEPQPHHVIGSIFDAEQIAERDRARSGGEPPC